MSGNGHNKSMLFDAFVICGIKKLKLPKQDVVTGLELITGSIRQNTVHLTHASKTKERKELPCTKYVDFSCGSEELWLKVRTNEENKSPIAHIDFYEAEFDRETGFTVLFTLHWHH